MAQYKNNTQKSTALLLVRNRLQITEIIQIDISRRWFFVCGSQSHWKGWRNRTKAEFQGALSQTTSAVTVCVLSHFSRVQPFATPWTVARQAPLFTGFYRQEYWSGLPFPPPGDLPHPGSEPMSPVSYLLHWPADSLPLAPPGKPCAVMGCTEILLQEIVGSGKMTPSAGNPIISCPATLPHITELQLYFLHVQNLDSIQNTSYSGLGNVVFNYRKSALVNNCKNNLLGPKRLLTSDAVL